MTALSLSTGNAIKLAAIWSAGIVAGAVVTALAPGGVGVVAACLLGLPVCVWLGAGSPTPLKNLVRALQASTASYGDGHFGHSLVSDFPKELKPLVDAHNDLGEVLRIQRNHLVQRELMLETIVENSPVAIALVDHHARVAFANSAFRSLICEGRRPEGEDFGVLTARLPESARHALDSGEDGVFAMDIGDYQETLLLMNRRFRVRGLPQQLYVLRPVTREIARTEVATWKKVIRVVTHELNNAVAPISSLAFTGGEWARAGALDRLPEIFAGIRERTEHLQRFVHSYASFARLPAPRHKTVDWENFVAGLSLQSSFCRVGSLPDHQGHFDPGQLEQVLANLIKNAHESGSPAEAVQLEIAENSISHTIEVRDRGAGMTEAILANAFLPFYSTKRTGTGLGLAVAREIIESHQGRLTLSNRRGGGLAVTIMLPVPVVKSGPRVQRNMHGTGKVLDVPNIQ